MDTGALREDMLADDRFVGRNVDARVGLNQTARFVDLLLSQTGFLVQLVFDHGQDTAQRGVTGTLTQAIHGGVYTLDTGTDGGINIGHR